MTMSRAQQWVQPYGLDVRTLPAGRWWDAVRVPLSLGIRALDRLGGDTGPVIKDGHGSILYWLVKPGAADHWQLPEVRVLGPGCHVAVPPQHRMDGPGLHWCIPLTSERYWTSLGRLHSALQAAPTEISGRRTLARVCCRCERNTEAPVLVRIIEPRPYPARAVYACPDCVPHCPAGPGRLD
ncbi:hypothetical protein [Streptomyces sp. ISL-10]|uniref:hypothetical protein n=1 Tax=Streptomyces sp. ISL-10 TaxID=2819172 RepID=UPI002035B061|nr:hypothetical protein [Streptomyces sp. ISL-10]